MSLILRGTGRPAAYRFSDGSRGASVTTIEGARKHNPEPLYIWNYNNGYEDGYESAKREAKGLDPIPRDHKRKLREAANAGSIAHAMVDNAIHSRDPMEGVEAAPAEILALARKGYDAFLEWQTVMDVTYLATEIPMVNEEHRYGGTPDAIGRLKDGRVALLDWKTSGGVYGSYIIQMAAYKHLWDTLNPEKKIEACYLLRFGKEHGDFHFHSYPSEVIAMGWRAFLHLREMYELDKQLKKVVG